MANDVIMPQMGFDMKEGTLVRWIKHEGDSVASGDIIAEIETDKAVVEIEAFDSGILRKTMISEGTTVPVGAVIAVIGTTDEQIPETSGQPAATAASQVTEAPKTLSSSEAQPANSAPAPKGERKASPLARREAQKLGLDIASIPGSGPNGRITKQDVLAYAAGPEAQPTEPPSPMPSSSVGPKRGDVIVPTKMRDAIARSMTFSKQNVPHIYITIPVDMTDAVKLRAQLNDAFEDQKVSVNDMVLRACAIALVKHPLMNASYTDVGIEVREQINIGMAIALEAGLVAPAVPDTDSLSLLQIAAETKSLVARARDGKLSSKEYTGATFNVTNLGMYGVESFTAIITPPQAAALAVGAVQVEPVSRDGKVKVASIMRVTLSLDHRVADGAQGSEFLAQVKRTLENPAMLLV